MSLDPMNRDWIYKLLPIINTMRAYHRHVVYGLENVPEHGRALLAVNHSLATYDIAFLFAAIFEKTGRIVRPMADHLFFKIPYLGDVTRALGAFDGNYANATTILRDEQIVGVAPGGMREALRPSQEKYQIYWEKRKGFIKVAIDTQTPIILSVCPRADDLYEVYKNPITPWAYKKFKVPLFIARGLGPSPLPRPVQLVHFISKPFDPPPISKDKAEYEQRLLEFHKKIVKEAKSLLRKAVKQSQNQD